VLFVAGRAATCAFLWFVTDEASNRAAFQQHFNQELSQYSKITVISLVDQNGKEKVISDAFLTHILTLNDPLITYITYDFHEYW